MNKYLIVDMYERECYLKDTKEEVVIFIQDTLDQGQSLESLRYFKETLNGIQELSINYNISID